MPLNGLRPARGEDEVMKKALAPLVVLGLLLAAAWPAVAASRGLTVYMARGKGAVSILDQSAYQNVFKNGIFAGDKLQIDLTSGKADFLKRFFAAQIVYLSLHANPDVWVVPNGDRVGIVDLIRAYTAAGKKGPSLVIVTGCSTIHMATKVNFPAAVGITPATQKKAYLGYTTFTVGEFSDRYFRVFLGQWMQPKSDGSYRTLVEARDDAKAFIQRMLTLQGPNTGVVARFAPLDASVAGWFTIVGDSDLRVTDL